MKISLDAKKVFEELVLDKEIEIYLNQMKNYHIDTYEHSLRVGLFCIEISLRKGFNTKDVLLSGISGLLHDVGKLCIPIDILSKKEKLTEKERKIIKKHPKFSYELLDNFFNQDVKKIVVSHHEFDVFSSYPREDIFSSNSKRKLNNDVIQRISQIVAVADVYDALSSSRSYKEEFAESEIFDIMFSPNFVWDNDLVLEILK